MKDEAVHELCFWNDTIPYQDGDTWGFQPTATLEESTNSLSVPVSDSIPLSPLNQAGIDFNARHRQGPWPALTSREQLLKMDKCNRETERES